MSACLINWSAPVESKKITVGSSGNGNQDVPTDFVAAAVKQMACAQIVALDLCWQAVYTVATAENALSRLFPSVFTKIMIKDRYGERVDLSTGGNLLKHVNGVEFGLSYNDGQNLTASAPTVYRRLRIPTHPYKCKRPSDFHWSAKDLLEGGQITISAANTASVVGPASGNRFTLTSMSYWLEAWMLDEGRCERKSRMIFRDISLNNAEDWYKIGDSRLRWAMMYVGQTGDEKVTQDTWFSLNSSVEQKITSKTLGYDQVRATSLQRNYQYQSRARGTGPTGTLATDSEDGVLQGVLEPVFTPGHEQPMTQLPDIPREGGLHVRTDHTAIPSTGAKMLLCYIEDDPARKGCAGEATARVKLADGRTVPTVDIKANGDKLQLVNEKLTAKLPGPEYIPG